MTTRRATLAPSPHLSQVLRPSEEGPRRARAAIALRHAGVLVTLLLAGCGGAQMLLEVTPEHQTVSPGAEGAAGRAVIRYRVGAPALLTASLEDQAGRRYVLRNEQPRPAGTYVLAVDGTYAPDDGPLRRQVVPAGEYTLVLAARDGAGATVERRATVRVLASGNDTRPPALESVAALPPIISPFDPRYEPQTSLSYSLDKPAQIVVALQWPPGRRTTIRPAVWREAGAYAEPWDGLVAGGYPPDGTYRFEVEARDRAGNVVAREGQVTLAGTRPPDARIARVRFTPTRLTFGETVRVEITVHNVGQVTLRSQGPPPDFTYTSSETFSTVAGGQYALRRNYWRVGVDWVAGPAPEGGRYPYRWGFGRDLDPGEETTVVGHVRLVEPFPQLRLYAGLIREGVAYHVDRVGVQVVELAR